MKLLNKEKVTKETLPLESFGNMAEVAEVNYNTEVYFDQSGMVVIETVTSWTIIHPRRLIITIMEMAMFDVINRPSVSHGCLGRLYLG